MASGLYIMYGKEENELELEPMPFDVIRESTLESTATTTELPVESGRAVSDNTIHKPKTIELEGIVSSFNTGKNGKETPETVMALLKQMKDAGAFFVFESELDFHYPLLLLEISNTQNVQSGDSLRVEIVLQEFRMIPASPHKLTKEHVVSGLKIPEKEKGVVDIYPDQAMEGDYDQEIEVEGFTSPVDLGDAKVYPPDSDPIDGIIPLNDGTDSIKNLNLE